MKITLEGPWPAWVAACTDRVLLARLGSGAHTRGAAYAQQRAVLTLSSDGEVLSATVRGSGRKVYQTVVREQRSRAGGPDFTGSCSCPMDVDCKHVAAVLITARTQIARPAPSPAPPAWQSRLADLIRPTSVEATPAVLGLQLDIVGGSQRAGAATAQRVRLRPVTPGKSGKWIKTGVGWRDLESGYSAVRVGPEHRELLRLFTSTYRARQPAWYSSYHDPQIHLDDLGASVWGLLARAQQTGLALLSGTASRKIELLAPAAVVLDLSAQPGSLSVGMTAVARLDEGPDVPLSEAWLMGSPAHGAVCDTGTELLLIPFTATLDATTHQLVHGGALQVPAADLPVFLGRYYPALRQRIAVASLDGSVELPEVKPPHLVLQVRFEPGHETVLDWYVGYPTGDQVVLVQASDTQVARDPGAERDLLAGLPDVPGLGVDAAGQRQLAPSARLTGMGTALFVRDVLPALQSCDDVVVEVTGDPAAYDESTEAPRIGVATHDSPVGDWFDLQITVSVSGQEVPIADLITALALDEEQLLLPSGTWFALDRPELRSLRRIVEEARSLQDKESTTLRLTPFHAGLWEELVSLGVVEHQSARWSATVGSLLALETLPHPDPPVGLQATLRLYQLEGYQWLSLLWDHQLGGILADDMGLGKTVQTLAMVVRAREQGTLGGTAGPLLVVTPTSVVGTWAREAARFAPSLRVVAISETAARSGRDLAELTEGADVVVTSYALFRIDDDAYQGLPWCGLVLDEAQFVKNHQAQTYQCARRLATPFKLAITGTPLENSLMDLWSMLSITAPGLFPNPQRFTELFRRPIENGTGPEQLAVLRRRIRPLMLRRTKEQVAPDLPPKIEQVLTVQLNPQHRKVYDKHLARERQRILGLLDDLQANRIAILSALTTLRQLSLDASLVDTKHAGKVRSSKIDALLEQLQEVVAEGHRVLVFSQFTGFLALVRSRLVTEGIAHCYLDGRTRNRPARIAEFTDGDAPVFLISLKAGGVGLTLTEADYVFVLDPWWNPAVEAQAVDRAHRIGQDKPVMVYRLVAADTIEEKVVALQQRKRDLFAQVVDDAAMTSSALTADDIRGLFC